MSTRSLKSTAVAVWFTAVLFALGVFLLSGSSSAQAATPPAIAGASVSDVAASSATFEAEINPEGSAATYRFEYGTSESYGTEIPVPDGIVGAGEGPVAVQAHPQDLQPHTTYHFRVVATGAGGSATGTDQTFTTQTTGGELVVPDERQWELVSPPDKEGALIDGITFEGSPVQASAEGGAMAYATEAPTEANPEGSRSPEDMELLATRGPDGWSSKDIAPPHNGITPLFVGEGQEYRLFSSDLAQSIVQPRGQTLLSPQATEQTIYLRDSTSGDFTPLVTVANTIPGAKFGGGQYGSALSFDGASPDLSHIVLSSPVALTSASGGGGLYEWQGGQLELVSVLPDGTASGGLLGTVEADQADTVSDDGSRVIWSQGYGYGSPLYLRDTSKHETIEVNAVQGGSGEGGETAPLFRTASNDGSRIFFTDFKDLTAGATANANAPDLYEFEAGVGEKLAGTLSDLSIDPNPGEAANVLGTLGTGEDGADIYYVAQGRLTGEPRAGCLMELGATELTEEEVTQEGRCRAKRGADNLYVHEPDPARPGQSVTEFIASLSPEDFRDWQEQLVSHTSRVSPNSRYLAFMSQESLTGYDNLDVNGNARDEEVYLYDATTSRLLCASCNPTGARPTGVHAVREGFRGPVYDPQEFWGGRWLAATVPGWTGVHLSTAIYQSRYLSNSGRLFFNGFDALVPQDTNGELDVYEYEPAGVGSCQATDATFSARSGGCVNLISSGSSGEESAFVDASESGNDVFLLTSAQLSSEDIDNAYDMYDAHACTASAPCPASAATPPPCTTADSCRAAPMPQPAIFGASASATFSGAGNPVASSATPKATTKSRAKATSHALKNALRACNSKPRRQRAACRARARRRNGTAARMKSPSQVNPKAKRSSRRGK